MCLSGKKVLMFLSQDTFAVSHFMSRIESTVDEGMSVTVVARKTSEEAVSKLLKAGCVFIDSKIERSEVGFVSLIKNLSRLRKILNFVEPDILHNYGTKSIILGSLIALASRKKIGIVNNLTGLGYIFSKNTFKNYVLRVLVLVAFIFFLNPRNSRLISENRGDIEFLKKLKLVRAEEAYCIPGAGINLQEYKPVAWEYKEKTITAIMASRWLHSKGVLVFLDAAGILQQRGVRIKMWLVGAPDESNPDSLSEKEVIEKARNIQILKVLGYRSDVVELLKKCHICVLPTYYKEGLPRFLIEGAATGLPIITTNIEGCREVVKYENGVAIDKSSSIELANALENFVNNKEGLLATGENSRQLAERLFDENKINQQIIHVYIELLLPICNADGIDRAGKNS